MVDTRPLSGEVALCADDYGIAEGVSRAILDLVDAGRLSGVSAMASTPSWPELARELVSRRGQVAIGLHLDLTLSPFDGLAPALPLRDLMLESLFGRLDIPALTVEFERQFDAFERATGFSPDHVDGHHHIHAMPQVRDALLAVLGRRYWTTPIRHRPLVRDPTDKIGRILARRGMIKKAFAMAMLGAGFRKRLAGSGFPANRGFAGFSAFRRETPFDRELDAFLIAPGPRHLVMCHPGLSDAALDALDPLCARRRDEYLALKGRDDIATWMLRIERRADDPGMAFARWLHCKWPHSSLDRCTPDGA